MGKQPMDRDVAESLNDHIAQSRYIDALANARTDKFGVGQQRLSRFNNYYVQPMARNAALGVAAGMGVSLLDDLFGGGDFNIDPFAAAAAGTLLGAAAGARREMKTARQLDTLADQNPGMESEIYSHHIRNVITDPVVDAEAAKRTFTAKAWDMVTGKTTRWDPIQDNPWAPPSGDGGGGSGPAPSVPPSPADGAAANAQSASNASGAPAAPSTPIATDPATGTDASPTDTGTGKPKAKVVGTSAKEAAENGWQPTNHGHGNAPDPAEKHVDTGRPASPTGSSTRSQATSTAQARTGNGGLTTPRSLPRPGYTWQLHDSGPGKTNYWEQVPVQPPTPSDVAASTTASAPIANPQSQPAEQAMQTGQPVTSLKDQAGVQQELVLSEVAPALGRNQLIDHLNRVSGGVPTAEAQTAMGQRMVIANSLPSTLNTSAQDPDGPARYRQVIDDLVLRNGTKAQLRQFADTVGFSVPSNSLKRGEMVEDLVGEVTGAMKGVGAAGFGSVATPYVRPGANSLAMGSALNQQIDSIYDLFRGRPTIATNQAAAALNQMSGVASGDAPLSDAAINALHGGHPEADAEHNTPEFVDVPTGRRRSAAVSHRSR